VSRRFEVREEIVNEIDEMDPIPYDGGMDGPTLPMLRRLGRALGARHREHLERAGFGDLPAGPARLLPLLAGEGARVTEVAVIAGVSKQAVKVAVDQLERGGYARRSADPADGRAKVVRLTPRGRAALVAARDGLADIERELTARVGAARLGELRGIVGELLDALGPAAPAPHAPRPSRPRAVTRHARGGGVPR
jgi:DNA-binding MarR family transcriptional regulator